MYTYIYFLCSFTIYCPATTHRLVQLSNVNIDTAFKWQHYRSSQTFSDQKHCLYMDIVVVHMPLKLGISRVFLTLNQKKIFTYCEPLWFFVNYIRQSIYVCTRRSITLRGDIQFMVKTTNGYPNFALVVSHYSIVLHHFFIIFKFWNLCQSIDVLFVRLSHTMDLSSS